MQNANDINGKRAKSWPMAKFQFEKLKFTKPMSAVDVFNSAKNNIKILIKALYSDKNDKRTRNIVDLILLRSKADFESLEAFKANGNAQLLVESIEKICDDVVKQRNEDLSYEDALNSALNKFKSALKRMSNADLQKDIEDEDNLLSIESDYTSFADEEKSHSKVLKRKSHMLDDVIKTLNSSIDKTNDLICTISISINEQFAKLEKMLVSSSEMMYDGVMSVLCAINGVQSKQLSYIQQEMKNVKIPFFNDKQNASKKKKMDSTLQIYGMNIDTEIIDNLSTKSQKTILTIAVTIKKHYQKICMPLADIFAVVKGNAKYTIELINDALQDGFDYWIRRLFGKVQDYVTEHIVKPLKEMIIDYIKRKIPNVFKALNTLFKTVIELTKGAWKLVKGIFRIIWRFIKKIFTGLLRGFVKTMKFMFRMVIKTLKAIWRLIVLALQALWQLVRWAGRGLLRTWNWLKNTQFMKKTRSFIHKVTSPFRWVRDKVVNGFRKIKNGAKALGRGISRGIGYVKNGIVSSVRGTGRFIGRQVSKVGRVFGRMIPKFARDGFKRSITLLKKIPLKRMVKWLGFKLARMVGRKVVLKTVKDGLLKKVIRGVAKFAAKLISKKVISKTLGTILKVCMAVWTMYDLWEGYKWLKKNLEVYFREVGPPDAPDVTQPWWFEKWIWSIVSKRVANYARDPKSLAEDIKNILKGIYEYFFVHESSKVARARRKQEWYIYANTYHSFNNTYREGYGEFNDRNINQTNSLPTYFGLNEEHTNIQTSGLLKAVNNLFNDRRKINKLSFKDKWHNLKLLLEYHLNIILASAKGINNCHRWLGDPKTQKDRSELDEWYLELFKEEQRLLRACASVGLTENILIRQQHESINPFLLGIPEIEYTVNYPLANNEAVNALRMLDYIENMDEIKSILQQRLSVLREFFHGKDINMKYIEDECTKMKKKFDDFANDVHHTYDFVSGNITIYETKCDEILDKLGEEDDDLDLENDELMIVNDDMYEGSEYDY